MEPTIVAWGGLRPAPGRTHPLVDHVLALTGKERARVTFLGTATGDRTEYIAAFYDRFPAARTERSHVLLFWRTIKDLRAHLLAQDIVCVGGGNTANMLAVWRVHGVDRALRDAWEAGVIMCGGSAGSLCWFQCGTTDSFDLNELAPLNDGLGFLPGSHCPHYDGEAQRRPLYQRLVGEGFPAGIAVDDDAAAVFEGKRLKEVVSARAGATAYLVERTDRAVIETPLQPRMLV
ncbi:MAG: Type 1 glutamine amidotransferase-like domain-containing protein [Actinomycetota bacterium]